MLKDFYKFIARGNILDMAVGIIIGLAFSQLVSGLVSNVIMPPVGLIVGHVDFSSRYINLSSHTYASLAKAQAAGAPVIAYGLFFNALLNFVIVAFVMFVIVQQANHLKKAPALSTKSCPYCCSAIPLPATRCPQCTSQLGTSG